MLRSQGLLCIHHQEQPSRSPSTPPQFLKSPWSLFRRYRKEVGEGGLFFDNLGLKLVRLGTSLTGPAKGQD